MSEGSGGRSQESLHALKRIPISPTRLRSLSDRDADDSDFPTAAGAFAPAQAALTAPSPPVAPQRPPFNPPIAERAPTIINPLRPPPLRPSSLTSRPLSGSHVAAPHAPPLDEDGPEDAEALPDDAHDAVNPPVSENPDEDPDAASERTNEGDSGDIPEPMLSSLHSAPSLGSHLEHVETKTHAHHLRSPRRGLVYASVTAQGVHIAIRYPEALQQALQPPLAARLSIDTEAPGAALSVVHTVRSARTDRTRGTLGTHALAGVPSGPQATSAVSPTASATARVLLADGMPWRPDGRGDAAPGLSTRLASSEMHDTLYDRLLERPPPGSHAAGSRTASVLTTPQVAAPVFYVSEKFLVCDGESAQQIYNRTLSREWEADDIFDNNPLHKLMLKGCEPFQTERLLGQNFKLSALRELQRLWVSTSDLSSLLIHTIGAPGLTHLAIVSCPNLHEIPTTLQHLKALKSLVIDSCAHLTSIEAVDRGVHWREVVLINCRKLSADIELASFEGLHVLVVEDCPGVSVECKVPVEHPIEVRPPPSVQHPAIHLYLRK